MFRFLNSTPARVVTILLLVQAGLLYSSIRTEIIPVSRPLAELPKTFGDWKMTQQGVIDKETMDVLQADDTLTRQYSNGVAGLDLFVAGFRSQRTGKAPHSPKNCLPGSGWEPLADREITVDIGRAEPISVNRYVITHGDSRQLVYYWYQSRDRAVAGEFKAKFWVVADAIRYNRTDTALVRVIVPIVNKDEAPADRRISEFIKTFYPTLLQYLPA
jgi:EpsI family protein